MKNWKRKFFFAASLWAGWAFVDSRFCIEEKYSFLRESGYSLHDLVHQESCGPVNLSKTMSLLKGKEVTAYEISKKITYKDGFYHNLRDLLGKVFYHKFYAITFPDEINSYFKDEGIDHIQINGSDSYLKDYVANMEKEGRFGVALFKNNFSLHWVPVPEKNSIGEYVAFSQMWKGKNLECIIEISNKNLAIRFSR